jgi:hypothetical protein
MVSIAGVLGVSEYVEIRKANLGEPIISLKEESIDP